MESLTEFIYHATGLCGEHSHPHLLNLGLLTLVVYAVYKYRKARSNADT